MKLFGAKSKRMRIGVALSGGGARGFAHVGVLKAMEEFGIKPDIIAGVSAGSVAAVMYAAGLKPDDVLKYFSEVKFSDLCELSIPKDGFFKLDGFKAFLAKHLPYEKLEELPIPTLVCATELDAGTYKIFSEGKIVDRVAASCCIPIIFKPVRIDGINYVDGGVLHNLPARAIREQCDFLIGVNCSPLRPEHRKTKSTIIDVATRSYMLMSKNNAEPDMEMCDLVIQTKNIADYKAFNLKEIKLVYMSGYGSAIETLSAAGYTHLPSEQP